MKSPLLMAAMIGAFSGPLPIMPQWKENPKRECRLPGCDILTSHNGGYCSAEHCKEHRKRRKEG